MSTADERAALIARQGIGARYDAAEAPADALLLARRGTAYFARVLNGLTDDELMQPACARVVTEVGYNARRLAEALAGLRTGKPIVEVGEARDATSLPARALRGLFQHSAIHLDVEWRDLPGPMWAMTVPGLTIFARDSPRVRAEFVWDAAVQIGGRISDLPPEVR
jgi:maleylpyruvate isomerase